MRLVLDHLASMVVMCVAIQSAPQHFTRKEPFALICVIISVSPPCAL